MNRIVLMAALVMACPVRAELECGTPWHDAGTARTGNRLVHEFALVNTGRTPLTILAVKASCGCLKAEATKKVIVPGERATLRLEAATATQAAGKNVWRATVRYRQGDSDKELSVAMTANLIADVSVTPATMVLHASKGVSHPFTLVERRAEPMRLLTVRCTSPHVQAVAGMPQREGGHWERRIVLCVLPTCPEGRIEAALHLGSAEFPDLRVPFSVEKKSADAVRASPASLYLIREGSAPLPSRLVRLDSGNKAVAIKSVKPGHAAIHATWARGPGDQATMRLTFDGAKIGPEGLTADVAVELAEPTPQVVHVRVTVGGPR